MMRRKRSFDSRSAKSETKRTRNSTWPARKKNSVPKNNNSSPAAGVINATTGRTTLGAEISDPAEPPNNAACN
jgi:hypothetical protein